MSPFIWIIDYGASHHIPYDDKLFMYLNHVLSMSIMTNDDTHMTLAYIASISKTNMSFFYIYYIHNITLSLVFDSQLCDSGYSATFSSTFCCVQDPYSIRLIEINYT